MQGIKIWNENTEHNDTQHDDEKKVTIAEINDALIKMSFIC